LINFPVQRPANYDSAPCDDPLMMLIPWLLAVRPTGML